LEPSIKNPLGHPWFIHRKGFDLCLRELVRSAGAAFVNEAVERVDFGAEGVSLLTKSGAIQARWSVLATGSPSWPARMTRQKPQTLDLLIAYWATLPVRSVERLLFLESSDYGWWYTCPSEPDGVVACFITDVRTAKGIAPSKRENWSGLFARTKLFRSLNCETTLINVNVSPTGMASLPCKYGNGWVAIGDAAVRLDPLGSSGTISAIDSGIRASNAVADALQGNNTTMERYGRWSSGLFLEFARQRKLQYAIEGAKRSEGFWIRRLNPAA
jgi:flavin-dependent dehydrogenase